MSHFSVLVFHDEGADLFGLLEPWMERCCGEPSRQYMEFYEDEECDVDDETGRRGFWQNPNARWDWFAVGETSRWSGMLRLKDGSRADAARVGDVDFTLDERAYAELLAWWDKAVEGKLEPGEKAPLCFPPAEELKHKYPEGREQFARARARFSTYAVVKDGEWHEQGRMGWWGLSDEPEDAARTWPEEYHARFIEGCDPDMWVTVVDCHI